MMCATVNQDDLICESHIRNLQRANIAQNLCAAAFGVSHARLGVQTRGNAQTALARQLAMYLAHVGFEMSLAQTAIAFGRDRSTVAYACHRIEDLREDEAFDRWVAELEAMVHDLDRTPPIPGGR